LNGRAGRAADLIAKLQGNEWPAIADGLYNSLEAPAFDKYPVLSLYKEFLREHGALASLMSGSGSTTFAITDNLAAAEKLGEKFKSQFGGNGWLAAVNL
jgi:4-diphosphocytidyl-2-C-methyl-D-erythritol kinase